MKNAPKTFSSWNFRNVQVMIEKKIQEKEEKGIPRLAWVCPLVVTFPAILESQGEIPPDCRGRLISKWEFGAELSIRNIFFSDMPGLKIWPLTRCFSGSCPGHAASSNRMDQEERRQSIKATKDSVWGEVNHTSAVSFTSEPEQPFLNRAAQRAPGANGSRRLLDVSEHKGKV